MIQLAAQMSSVAEIQVQAEKERLEEARNIAQSEKALYVRVSEIALYIIRKIKPLDFNSHDIPPFLPSCCEVCLPDTALEDIM